MNTFSCTPAVIVKSAYLKSGNKAYYLVMTLVLAALCQDCSVEKNTGASRFYNSLISKYNIYFNGNEAYKAGIAKVKSSNRDDYSATLPVFEYSSPESVQACSGDMERATQKASKIVALYSITAKPEENKRRSGRSKDEEFYNRKEYNEWVDDAYLLMAKAQFYQKNFTAARATLSFNLGVTTDPEIIEESTIWMSRILTEDGNYSEAGRILQSSGDIESWPRNLRSMASATLADIALRQKKYEAAIDPLTNAIALSGDKSTRVRFTYLLAQVYKAAGNNALSTKYFKEVIKMNPSYEYEFNAGINLAGVTDLSSGDADDLKRSLNKMIRDSKNKDYLDQIYFALAELSRRKGDINEAKELYTKSALSSKGNNRQKARAYLALGEYYFSLPQYAEAHLYYDSTIALIDNRFPDYDFISDRSSDLAEYAGFHTVVTTEDSLRKVAQMGEAERDRLISELIRKVEEDEMKGSQDINADRYNMGEYYENERRSEDAISSEGSWYFYNQAALTFGRTEFRRRWGDRKLEDNWRRANRSRITTMPGTANPEEARSKGDSAAVAPEKSKEYYIKNLPLSDSLMTLSVHKSADALLGEGKILASRLNDTALAIISLEAATKPGGTDNTRAEALYELYRLFRETDPPRAERRRADLLSLFPETDFALILSDPDYVRKQNEVARQSLTLYETAYDAYSSDRFEETSAICSEALLKYADDELAPKFMLLDAMASGALKGEMEYKTRLDSLAARYPGTPEGKRANEIIAVLRREIPEIRVAEDMKIVESLYVTDTLQPHYIIITAENIRSNLNRMVFDIINYNLDNYSDKNYTTEGSAIDDAFLLITVGVFKSFTDASAYLEKFNPLEAIRSAEEAQITVFIISRDNLAKFRGDKNIPRYRLFYDASIKPLR